MNWRRRNYLINKRYQLKFITAFLALSLSGIIASTALIFYFVQTGIQENLYRSHLKISHLNQVVVPVAFKIDIVFFTAGVFCLLALSFYFSKKLERLKMSMSKGLKEIRDGKLDSQFLIGHKQEFPKLEEEMNNMLESLRSRVGGYKKLSGELDEAVNGPEINPEKIKLVAGQF